MTNATNLGEQASRTTTLRATGFSCPSCVTKIERHLEALPYVRSAKVQFATSKITVEHDAAVTAQQLADEVGKAGYKARPSAF